MNRKIRPTKSHFQLKDEQVNFLLEDIKKLRGIQTNSRNKVQTASRSKKKYCKEQKVVTKLLEKKKKAVKRIYSKN